MIAVTYNRVTTVIHLEDDDREELSKILDRARRERTNFKRRLANPKFTERNREYWKRWKAANAEKIKVQKKKWRAANKNHIRAYERKYYQLSETLREYRAMKNREYRARRKQREVAA